MAGGVGHGLEVGAFHGDGGIGDVLARGSALHIAEEHGIGFLCPKRYAAHHTQRIVVGFLTISYFIGFIVGCKITDFR
jgi:hypothetical protein